MSISLALPPTPATAESTPTAARILVVDDDAAVRALEALILKRSGFAVDTAFDGSSAWRALLLGSYDLLVTDYLMPGISGLALVRQLRVVDMELPVVLVSGTMQALDTARLRRDPWTRIHAFVRKPFLVAEFLEAVDGALSFGSKMLLPA
jgi:CheY-like chemotaxis protein